MEWNDDDADSDADDAPSLLSSLPKPLKKTQTKLVNLLGFDEVKLLSTLLDTILHFNRLYTLG